MPRIAPAAAAMMIGWFCVSHACLAQCRSRPKAAILPNGLTLTIRMDKPVARIDQPVAIHLVLSNNSSSPVAMMDLWAPHVNYELYLHDTQGKEAPLSDLGRKLRTNPTGGSADRLVLAPGDKFEMDEDLSKIYSVSVPGSYTVEACRQIMNWGNIYSNKLVIPFTH